jgi:glutamate racemase
MGPHGPIGVFDSGIGGLSVLQHIRARLPGEDLIYFADSGYAPYGDRTEAEVAARSLSIADFLLARGAKAIVVACNTATAAAIRAMRERYPSLPLVGVEPGLKPAAALSTTKTVGVLATRRTLASEKFAALREDLEASSNTRFAVQACVGLVDLIEKGELNSPATAELLWNYMRPLLEQGADTLVLGCTHYPFVMPLILDLASRHNYKVRIVDTGDAVARQLVRLLEQRALLNTMGRNGTLQAFTTGSATSMETAFSKLLKLTPPVTALAAQAAVQA